MTQRKIQYWVIPPEADSEFVANMENVLETYALPYNPKVPILCMDEQPVQLTKETRTPIPATKKHARRVDYEYERAGTACVFMFTEPLAGWREVTVRKRRTKVDWAEEMARLLRGRYAKAERIILVCDNNASVAAESAPSKSSDERLQRGVQTVTKNNAKSTGSSPSRTRGQNLNRSTPNPKPDKALGSQAER